MKPYDYHAYAMSLVCLPGYLSLVVRVPCFMDAQNKLMRGTTSSMKYLRISLVKVNTSQNPRHGFTKCLPEIQRQYCIKMMGAT